MTVKKDKYETIEEYYTEITYTCPTRGKVTEKVKVTRYDKQSGPEPVCH